jgi:hypothetical protein
MTEVEKPDGVKFEMEEWCRLSIVVRCGSLKAALDVLRRITDESEHPPAVHQNAIASALIIRGKE